MILALVFGIAAIIGFLTYFAFQMTEEHNLLQLLFLFFAVGLSVLIPSAIANYEVCEAYVANSTVTGNVTSNVMDNYCYKPYVDSSATTFFKATVWLLRAFTLYVIVFLGYKALVALKDSIRGAQ